METLDTEDFDRDAREQSEARVINISDEVVRFEIATQPGSKPRRYALQPFGKAGSDVWLQIGYTVPYRGVGRGNVRPTIESLTEREIIAEVPPSAFEQARPGVRVPFVVHEDKAEEARAAYVAAMAKAGRKARKAQVAPSTRASLTAPRQAAPAPPVEDVEDQDGPLDEPPPDDDLPPEPVTVGGKA